MFYNIVCKVGKDLCVVPPRQKLIIKKWLRETENNPIKWVDDEFYTK